MEYKLEGGSKEKEGTEAGGACMAEGRGGGRSPPP